MTPIAAGLWGFVLLVVLMFARIPVGFVMAIVGFLGFGLLTSWDASLNLLARDFFSIFGSYNLTVIPLFVLMGQIAHYTGISGRLFNTANKFLGHLPGGLAIATIGACAGFSAICGSTSATAATMASVALPEMKKYQYDPALATGVVAAGGSLGILIPPSTIFIIYGIMTEQSVGKLFMAGVLPGILLTVLFIVTIVVWIRLRPGLCVPAPKASLQERIASLTGVIETFILFVLVMGGLFIGLFTPTEAAAYRGLRYDRHRTDRRTSHLAGLHPLPERDHPDLLHDPRHRRRGDRLRPLPGRDDHPGGDRRLGGGIATGRPFSSSAWSSSSTSFSAV